MFRLEFLYNDGLMFLIFCICFFCFSWFVGVMMRDEVDEVLNDEKDNIYFVRYFIVILLILINFFKYNNRINF